MNIVTVEPLGISQERFEILKSGYEKAGHSFQYYMDRKEDAATMIERMQAADIVVVSNIKLDAAILSACPNLKLLSVAFTGLDHIDLAYCDEHHIEVVNAAGYSTTAVSELAVGLMIDVYRKVTELDGSLRRGGSRNNYVGLELKGKTVGVVGTGAIGTATIRLLQAFGCKVLAYNRTPHAEVESMGVKYLPLHEMLPLCDIVTLHVPLNGDTHHLIGTQELSLMKPSAILINTARGNVADIDAVAAALKQGTLAGAAFDVFEKEPPLSADHPLLSAPNCVCVPHVGFASVEAFAIRADIVFGTVNNYLGL